MFVISLSSKKFKKVLLPLLCFVFAVLHPPHLVGPHLASVATLATTDLVFQCVYYWRSGINCPVLCTSAAFTISSSSLNACLRPNHRAGFLLSPSPQICLFRHRTVLPLCGLEPQPADYKTAALPLSYSGINRSKSMCYSHAHTRPGPV